MMIFNDFRSRATNMPNFGNAFSVNVSDAPENIAAWIDWTAYDSTLRSCFSQETLVTFVLLEYCVGSLRYVHLHKPWQVYSVPLYVYTCAQALSRMKDQRFVKKKHRCVLIWRDMNWNFKNGTKCLFSCGAKAVSHEFHINNMSLGYFYW
jgi:hypothetical protein